MKNTLLINEEATALSPLWLALIQRAIDETLESEEFPYEAEVSFSLVDDEAMQTLNREQRGIDKTTDVLSFPMLETEGDTLLIDETDIIENRVFLGDIVISLPRLKEQSRFYGHSEERELGFLVVHSMLHLLGYDHEEGPREESEMFQKQELLLNRLDLHR